MQENVNTIIEVRHEYIYILNKKVREWQAYHIGSISEVLSYLKDHKLTVHEGVEYVCDQCDYQTSQKGQLKKH